MGRGGLLKVLVADDQALYRAGLRSVLAELDSASNVTEASSFRRATVLARSSGPFDLALVGLTMTDNPPFAGLINLRRHLPGVPIVVLATSEAAADVRRVIACGARGYVLRSSRLETLCHVLHFVLAGEIYVPPAALIGGDQRPAALHEKDCKWQEKLTPRERDVLFWLVEGCSNKEIAQQLAIAEGTVKVHLKATLRKLQVANRTQAAMLAVRQEWLAQSGAEVQAFDHRSARS